MGASLSLPNGSNGSHNRKRKYADESITMDIFSLPDVFLRLLMRKMEIKDRMTLRETCRAFENLVANTHAGCFERGKIYFSNVEKPEDLFTDKVKENKTFATIRMGNVNFRDVELTEDCAERFLHFRRSISNGIEFGSFIISVNCKIPCTEFVRNFTRKMEIGCINLQIDSGIDLHSETALDYEAAIENMRSLIGDHPQRRVGYITFLFAPTIEQLLSLPPTQSLNLQKIDLKQLFALPTVDTLLKLVSTHKEIFIHRGSSISTPKELKQLMQIISKSKVTKHLDFQLKSSTLVSHLRSYGIFEDTKDGDICGEFEFIGTSRERDYGEETGLFMRYGQCRIAIVPFGPFHSVWTGGDDPCLVTMANDDYMS